MVKYCIDKYPLGSLKGKKTPGQYMDGELYKNLKPLVRSIVRDMTFIGIITSSSLGVGTGKSVLASQIGEAFTEMMNDKHGLDLKFDENNVVFRPEKLMEKAPTLPKYSTLVLDEWDEKNYFDKLAMALRNFFRKFRQLNLFILIIIPDIFQLPKGYAISNSLFLIDVKFSGEFERGYFSFYDFQRKKTLYIKGKKTYNWKVCKPNFYGRFTDGYAYGEDNYRNAKRRDLIDLEETKKPLTEKDIKSNVFYELHNNLKDVSISTLSDAFGISSRTGSRWLASERLLLDKNKTKPKNDTDTRTR